jgi:hypothetical protein
MAIVIDPRYLDVDLDAEANRLGIPRGYGDKRHFAPDKGIFYGANRIPPIPRNQWPDLAARIENEKTSGAYLVTRIFDQGREGSCVANATAQAHEIVQALQFGKHRVVHLSAISLYKRIGTSPNSGSYVEDALNEMRKRGILPLAGSDQNDMRFKHVMQNTGFYTRFPQGWEQTAEMFRIAEYAIIDSIDELVNAQFAGFPVIVGRRGHSIVYIQPFYHGNKLYNLYVNSWGRWGQAAGYMSHGFGVDSYDYMLASAQYAVAVMSVTTAYQFV